MIGGKFEFCPEVRTAYLNLWEARAVALMNHSQVWAAVESVSAELQMSCGELDRGELVAAIERGMREGCSLHQPRRYAAHHQNPIPSS